MITFKKHSGIYTMELTQELPIDIDTAWDFFSSPKNLAQITPPYMGFLITSQNIEKMHVGQIITYKIGILPGIKQNWVTEITHIQDKLFFVDEQRFGPYALWHHQHHFEKTDDGILMTDILHYKVPFGLIGTIADALFVDNKIEEIFNYREKAVERIFEFEAIQT